jgi:hypothetical protein
MQSELYPPVARKLPNNDEWNQWVISGTFDFCASTCTKIETYFHPRVPVADPVSADVLSFPHSSFGGWIRREFGALMFLRICTKAVLADGLGAW